MGFARYVRAAFLNRWNLLAFLGATGFACLSGRPDIWLPLVLAGEISYLGFASGHPRFQKFVDVQAHGTPRSADSADERGNLTRILDSLPRAMVERYETLRRRCVELKQIARDLRASDPNAGGPFEALQMAGFDRLLWIFLRLLFTQFSLERFLRQTAEDHILAEIAQLEAKVERTEKKPTSPQRERVLKTLADHLTTSRARLDNYRKARDNAEFVRLEIDRLENKIRSLSEMAINRHEPDFISSQVDQVAGSMLETEQTMNELRFATGLVDESQRVPELLERPAVTATD